MALWGTAENVLHSDHAKLQVISQCTDEESIFSRVARPLHAQLPARCVLDGEIVVAKNDGLDFRNCSFGFIQLPRG